MPNDLRDWTSAAGAPQRGLANFQAPPNATTPNTVSISRGTHSVAVLLNSLTNVNSISVTGVQTGVVYAANLINLTAFGTLFFVPVLSDFDNQITVAVTMGIGAQTATVRVAEILDPEIVAIFQSNTLVVQGTGISASVVTDPIDRVGRLLGVINSITNAVDISDRVGRLLGVVQEGNNPPLWQAPRAVKSVETNVNGTQIVAGVGGQTIRVWGIVMGIDGTGFAAVRDDGIAAPNGRLLAWNSSTGAGLTNSDSSVNHGGVPITLGAGLILDTNAGAIARVGVSYSQG